MCGSDCCRSADRCGPPTRSVSETRRALAIAAIYERRSSIRCPRSTIDRYAGDTPASPARLVNVIPRQRRSVRSRAPIVASSTPADPSSLLHSGCQCGTPIRAAIPRNSRPPGISPSPGSADRRRSPRAPAELRNSCGPAASAWRSQRTASAWVLGSRARPRPTSARNEARRERWTNFRSSTAPASRNTVPPLSPRSTPIASRQMATFVAENDCQLCPTSSGTRSASWPA